MQMFRAKLVYDITSNPDYDWNLEKLTQMDA